MDIDNLIAKAKIDYTLGLYGFLREMPMRCEHGRLMRGGCKECLEAYLAAQRFQ